MLKFVADVYEKFTKELNVYTTKIEKEKFTYICIVPRVTSTDVKKDLIHILYHIYFKPSMNNILGSSIKDNCVCNVC